MPMCQFVKEDHSNIKSFARNIAIHNVTEVAEIKFNRIASSNSSESSLFIFTNFVDI